MRDLALLLSSAALASCAWGPVLTPYSVSVSDQAASSEVATVWGTREGAKLHFTHVNGVELPSRGGGGYPVSLRLAPGKHSLRAYFVTPDRRHAKPSLDVEVEAGHTYVVEHLLLPPASRVLLKLSDRGKSQTCGYERTDELRGNQVLRCSKR
jgi:hypothetical protein